MPPAPSASSTTVHPSGPVGELVKPLLRGVSHQWGALVFAIAGVVLVVDAPASARPTLAIYAVCITAMCGNRKFADRLLAALEKGSLPRSAVTAYHARQIGFPVLVKATGGGGGRGMRAVHEEKDLAAALRRLRPAPSPPETALNLDLFPRDEYAAK